MADDLGGNRMSFTLIMLKMKTRKVQQIKPVFDWQGLVNKPARLASCLRRLIALREGGLTRFWVLTVYHYARWVHARTRSVGTRGVVIYLKGCHVLLQQVVGGQTLDNPRRLGCAISRSRQGLPRIIPVLHRKSIMSGDIWVTKLWSSLFWLYRVLDCKGKIKLSTITAPFEVSKDFIRKWSWWLVQFLPILFDLIGRKGSANIVRARSRSPLKKGETQFLEMEGKLPPGVLNSIPIEEYISLIVGMLFPFLTERQVKDPERRDLANSPLLRDLKPVPITLSKSGPNSQKGPNEGPGPTTRTNTGSILTDILVWLQHPTLLIKLGSLVPEMANVALSIVAQAEGVFRELRSLDVYGKTLHEEDNTFLWEGTRPIRGFSYGRGLGKLGFLPEPAGKIRVFAMVDSLTQMLFKPLHAAVFEILKRIPQDGTHDQEAPAKLLAGKGIKTFWSYDLSAATDRFPISLQQTLLGFLLGPVPARQWRSILIDRDYIVPRVISEKQRVPRGTPETVRYGAGQPMGAYTSWAVFALTHHLLVQYAAFKAFGKFRWFELYALLGDDVVIAHYRVAEQYLLLLQEIGVEVGLAKSLISSNGTFEFAKKTYRSGQNVSGISLDQLGESLRDPSVLESLLSHCNVRGSNEALRYALKVLGYGGKALSGIPDLLARRSRLQGLAVLLTRPTCPWGVNSFAAWLTQRKLESSPPLETESWTVLVDAIRQRLISTIKKLMVRRDELLSVLNNPRSVEEMRYPPSPDLLVTEEIGGKPFYLPHLSDEEVDQTKSAPYLVDPDVNSSKLLKFLTDWVLKPQIKDLKRIDFAKLLTDLENWETGDPLEGGQSLDDFYRLLDETVRELEAADTTVNKLFRRQKEQSRRQETKIRTRLVKLWKGCRPIILR